MCDVSLALRSKVGLVNYLGSIVPSSVIRRSKMPAPSLVFVMFFNDIVIKQSLLDGAKTERKKYPKIAESRFGNLRACSLVELSTVNKIPKRRRKNTKPLL